jgi:nicotinamidase-related amidase
MAAIEARLDRLEAIEDIKHVIARYAEAADKRNDPVIFGSILSDAAIWEASGFGRYEGRSAITKALADISETQVTWTVHFMVLPTVAVAAGNQEAVCQWYLWELAKMKDPHGVERDTWFAAKYDCRLQKVGNSWLFTDIALVPMLNCPVGEPWPGAVQSASGS